MTLDPLNVQQWSALVVAVTFVLCGVLLLGFRKGRLRAYHVYVAFSVALLGIRLYAQIETGLVGGWWAALVWINLAGCGAWGLIGMLLHAGTEPSEQQK